MPGDLGTHPIWERQRGQCSKCRQLADGVEFLAAALECEERVRVTAALKKLNCRRYTVSVPSMIFFEMNSRRWRNLEEKIDHGHQHHCIRNNTLDEKQRASRVRHTWRYVPRTIFWASVAAEWLSKGMAPQSKEEEEPAVPAWVPGEEGRTGPSASSLSSAPCVAGQVRGLLAAATAAAGPLNPAQIHSLPQRLLSPDICHPGRDMSDTQFLSRIVSAR